MGKHTTVCGRSTAPQEPARLTTTSAVCTDDKRWFEQNPHRSHRLREPTFGERVFTGPLEHGQHLAIAVQQLRPGVRIRLAVTLAAPIVYADEETARAVFEGTQRGEHLP